MKSPTTNYISRLFHYFHVDRVTISMCFGFRMNRMVQRLLVFKTMFIHFIIFTVLELCLKIDDFMMTLYCEGSALFFISQKFLKMYGKLPKNHVNAVYSVHCTARIRRMPAFRTFTGLQESNHLCLDQNDYRNYRDENS